tara:strand:+ start:8224 stop:8529 length:306 start_codon:yes stop_codon:yes gene_type:complete
MTQDEGASSVKEHVRQAKSSLFSDLSSRGNRRFELFASVAMSGNPRATHQSEQKRKRMGSFLVEPPVSAAGEDMLVLTRRILLLAVWCVAIEVGSPDVRDS